MVEMRWLTRVGALGAFFGAGLPMVAMTTRNLLSTAIGLASRALASGGLGARGIRAPRLGPLAAMAFAVMAHGVGMPVFAATPMAPVEESWDGYSLGSLDAAYTATWMTLPGADRFEVIAPTATPSPWSPPNCLKIGKATSLGITRDLTPEIRLADPDATEVQGTDESPLRVFFIVDLNTPTDGAADLQKDVIVEVSKDDAHVDAASGTSKTVIAFGFANGLLGPSASPRLFDGVEWVTAAAIAPGPRSNHYTMEIRTGEVVISGAQRASGTETFPRRYRGGFNRVSVRVVDNQHRQHTLDDVRISGGSVSAGPLGSLRRGDADGGGAMDITDPIATLGYLFLGGDPPACLDAADADDSGTLDISDAIYALAFLFLGGPEPEDPFEDCGPDTTSDALDCTEFRACP
jgi:hypothetical protein